MSSQADAAAATVALFDSLYTSGYCDLAAVVIFNYDAFITFDRQVAYFWPPKRISGASLLFFANQWISMTYYVTRLVQFASLPSDKSCSLFIIVMRVIEILQLVPGAAFSALRAYVLSRSKLLGLLVAALSLAPVGINLVPFGYQSSGVNFLPFGCLESYNTTSANDLRLVLISRVPLIAADILLIYITWTTLRGSAALTVIRQSRRLTLSEVLFRGGTIYFVILFILNVLHLVFSATAVAANTSGSGYSLIPEFITPMTTILISRFLLELQESSRMDLRVDPDDPLHSSRNPYSTPSFVSSLGGFVNPARSALSDDDDGIELQARSPSEVPEEVEGGAQTEVPQEAAASPSSTE